MLIRKTILAIYIYKRSILEVTPIEVRRDHFPSGAGTMSMHIQPSVTFLSLLVT
jgi:hypothetical protein